MSNINNKLLIFIDALSESELSEFRKFIVSPLYTSGRNYDTFLNELIKQNKKNHGSISLHDLYSKLYPGKKFNGQTIKNRFSEILKLGEEFLIYRKLRDEPFEKDKLLFRAFIDRNLYKFLDNKMQKKISQIVSEPDDLRKFSNLLDLYQFSMNSLTHKKKYEKFFSEYFDNTIFSTGIFLNTLFSTGIEFKLQENLNRKYEFNPVLETLNGMDLSKAVKKFRSSEHTILRMVAMNYYLYKAFESGNEDNYFESRKIFQELSDSFSNDYKLELYKQFIYFCTRKQNQGFKKYHGELFKLFNEKLESGFYSDFSRNSYPLNSFRDYVFIGIELNKLGWVENFIEKYSGLLPDDIRDNEINIAYAKVSFAKKKFKDALSQIASVRATNFLHYIDISNIRLCCYYELDEFEEAFTQIDRAKHYIRNHKEIPKAHRQHFSSFLNFLHYLINVVMEPKKKDKKLLFLELEKHKFIAKRDWLNEKIFEVDKIRKAV